MDKPINYSDFKSLYKSIKAKKIKSAAEIKIAILSSFTTQGLDEVLSVKCYQQGIKAEVYLAPYNQYYQEIIDQKSKFHSFNPDLVIVMLDPISILGDYWLNPYQLSLIKRRKFINSKIAEIKNLIFQIKKTSHKIIINNFIEPYFSPLGILENKQQFGFRESISYLNESLQQLSLNDSSLFIYDYNSFCAKKGANSIMDYKLYYLADFRLSPNLWGDLSDDYLGYIKPMLSIIKKCIVLDLDNTLWGGVLGEDGMAGIKLGPTPEGRSFWEFQKYLLSLQQRGTLLAINSKNNSVEVLDILKNHPYMVLREESFSAIEANWEDKASNMRSIATQLNIGLDSLVFFDDDPFNRDLIRENLPEVTVIDLPEDTTLYLDTLININDFNTLQITEEDKNRGKMYFQERKRQELEKTVSNIDEFVKNLRVVLEIKKADDLSIPRISQLTQKTNQFNMTTKRYLEEEIKFLSFSDNYLVLSIKVVDKFGDYGLTGVVIIEKVSEKWLIDSFLLSCRVLGRKVEESILSHLIKEAKTSGAKRLIGQFIKTEKNIPAENFYRNNNFSLVNKTEGREVWELSLEEY